MPTSRHIVRIFRIFVKTIKDKGNGERIRTKEVKKERRAPETNEYQFTVAEPYRFHEQRESLYRTGLFCV